MKIQHVIIGIVLFACLAFVAGKKDPVFKIIPAVETTEGQGAKVKRLYRTRNLKHYDPFVIMDEFFVTPPAGFPNHPHRGFEAITYMYEGTFRHKDNLGNDSTINTGDLQRFTAGKGIIHSEMPGGAKVSHGIQLWINLPKKLKQTNPSYQQISSKQVPETIKKGLKVRHLVGNGSPLKLQTDVVYNDIMLDSSHTYTQDVNKEHRGYIYLVHGELKINKEYSLKPNEGFFYEVGTSKLKLKATKNSKLIFLSGKPHNEPIRQRGPFVD